MKERSLAKRLDLYGAGMSFLCILHCTGLPFLLSVLPESSGAIPENVIHGVGVPLALLLGIGSFVPSYRFHKRLFPLIAGILGLILLGSALFLSFSGPLVALPVTGGLLMGLAHLLNHRYRRKG